MKLRCYLKRALVACFKVANGHDAVNNHTPRRESVTPDQERAFGECQIAAVDGNEVNECDNTNNNQTLNSLQMEADAGDTNAMFNLAWCYYSGKEVTKDLEKAFDWYMKGAEAGDVDAANNLAICYEFGLGVPKNLTKALECYQKIAVAGDTNAMYNLADCHHKMALEWRQIAATSTNNSNSSRRTLTMAMN